MAKIKVAIFDADKGYRERFADYLMNHKAAEMELAVFTNEQFFFNAVEVDKFHLFVLGGGYEAVLPRARAKKVPVLVLTECAQSYVRETIQMLDEQVVYTSKYQSMDVITQKMQMLTDTKWSRGEVRMLQNPEVVGVVSPVSHEMQMLFSLLFACNVAREKRVLYVNMLEFSGFTEMFKDAEYDLSDAILQVRETEVKEERLRACIYELDSFSYILPVMNPENMREITEEDVRRLLEVVAEYMDYQVIILDVGLNVAGFADILPVCDRIFSLEKRGYLFETRTRQFYAYLEKMVDAACLERIHRLEIPGQAKVVCGGMNLLEQLNWGDFGDFVRSVV